MECRVCGEKYHTTMKPGPDGKFLPENWKCVKMCRLIHRTEKPAQKK
jgi:rubredoxin